MAQKAPSGALKLRHVAELAAASADFVGVLYRRLQEVQGELCGAGGELVPRPLAGRKVDAGLDGGLLHHLVWTLPGPRAQASRPKATSDRTAPTAKRFFGGAAFKIS